MKQRLLRVLKLLAFPAFYVICLALFGYVTFPFGRLKDRVIAELEKRGKPGQRIEIGKLGAYWFTGVEVSGVKLHIPPDEPPHLRPGAVDFTSGAAPAKESVIVIDEAHARVRILPLLLGRVRLDFWASAFGGEIKGSVPVGSAKGEIEVAFDHLDLSHVEPLAQLKVPIKGSATGKLVLEAPEGKFNKANGSLDLTIADMVVSDGTTKLRDLIVLPPAKLGDLVLTAEAKDGTLKITKLGAGGSDLEISGDGKISLREPWSEAIADLYLRFRFTDGYRGKNDLTKSLLGAPGAKLAGSIDLIPDMKQAKRADGFYGFKVWGPLKKLHFDPSAADPIAGPTPNGVAAPRRPMGKGLDGPRRPLALEGAAKPGPEGVPPSPDREGAEAPGIRPARNPALPHLAQPAVPAVVPPATHSPTAAPAPPPPTAAPEPPPPAETPAPEGTPPP